MRHSTDRWRPRVLAGVSIALTAAIGVSPAVSTAAPVTTAASAVATAAPVPPAWVFSGSGWGHGVGMSQYGAYGMAREGASAATILEHYYTGTTYGLVADTKQIRVNLQHEVASTSLSTSAKTAGGGAFTIAVGASTMTGGIGSSIAVTRSGANVVVSCTGTTACSVPSLTGAKAVVTWNDGRTFLHVDGKRLLQGRLEIAPSPEKSTTIEVVADLRIHDEYLDYIREVPWSWPAAALQAQAAAARSYAVTRSAISRCLCDAWDNTYSQVFGGYPADKEIGYWQNWWNAVHVSKSTTQGHVPLYGGKPISAVYSSSTGGRTQNSEDVWGGKVDYLKGVDDHWSLDSANKYRSWTQDPSVTQAQLAGAFGLANVVRLDLRQRTQSGSVARAVATSSTGATATLTGEQLRAKLGLKSTWVHHVTSRLGGPDRYAVSVAVTQQIPVSARSLVLASGEDISLADAAVSGPLARALGAPLLLTGQAALTAVTGQEIDRRRAASLTTVYVVGGPGAVSDSVIATLRGKGLTVHRVHGADRYATSAAVFDLVRQVKPVSAVVVASGTSLVDALAASGPAAATTEPIVLTPPTSLRPATLTALNEAGVKQARITGGTGVVFPAVESQLTSSGVTTTRLSGNDRYATAAAVATYYRPRVPSTRVIMTSGANASLVDSLSAGALGSLIVLTTRDVVPEASLRVLQESASMTLLTAVGGTAVVSDTALTRGARS